MWLIFVNVVPDSRRPYRRALSHAWEPRIRCGDIWIQLVTPRAGQKALHSPPRVCIYPRDALPSIVFHSVPLNRGGSACSPGYHKSRESKVDAYGDRTEREDYATQLMASQCRELLKDSAGIRGAGGQVVLCGGQGLMRKGHIVTVVVGRSWKWGRIMCQAAMLHSVCIP